MSPSANIVAVNESRGTISRLRSTTTRPGRIRNDSSSPKMLSPSVTSVSSPLILIFINKKPHSHGPPDGGQGIRFQVHPAGIYPLDFDFHASLRRCDPDQVQRVTCFSGSQSDARRHP